MACALGIKLLTNGGSQCLDSCMLKRCVSPHEEVVSTEMCIRFTQSLSDPSTTVVTEVYFYDPPDFRSSPCFRRIAKHSEAQIEQFIKLTCNLVLLSSQIQPEMKCA